MRVTYDPGKSSRNEELRGLSFELVRQFDWSGAQLIEDTRKDYNEQRIQALGHIGEHLHVMVFTPRDGAACDQPAPSEPQRKDPLCRASPTPNWWTKRTQN